MARKLIIAVTEDGSRWLLDPEYVEGFWQEYCSDISFVVDGCGWSEGVNLFLDFLFDAHYDSGVEDWLYPVARLLVPSTEVQILFDTGKLPPLRRDVEQWASDPALQDRLDGDPVEDAYAQGWERVKFELPSPGDRDRISAGNYFEEAG